LRHTDLPERISTKIAVDPNGCWLWTGAKTRGYGSASFDGRRYRAHRLTYELLVGPIPEGLTLDHLCRVTACVNPAHLEPVTQKENIRRGETGENMRSKTHCPMGHPFDEKNTYLDPKGHRRCRECRRQYRQTWRAANPDTHRASSREYMRRRRAEEATE
jgi:hypothetical protein